MKNLLLTVLIAILATLLVSGASSWIPSVQGGGSTRQTEGNLNFTVRTVTYYGPYAPRNAGVIWITNSANQFVKTIKIWASQYRYTLVRWNASSGGNTTGAITGASLNNHILHNVNWNGTNTQGTQVPDGDYKVNVEFTEHNATAGNMGKFFQYTFAKGPNPINQTIPNQTYFVDMTLNWQPVLQNGILSGNVVDGSGNPIYLAQLTTGSFSWTTDMEGSYIQSLPPGEYSVTCAATGFGSETVTGVVILPEQVTTQNFQLEAVANDDPQTPETALTLAPPSPNPFRESCRISYSAKGAGPVRLEILNARGQKLLVSERDKTASGLGELIWDGRDSKGIRCPAGIYLLRLRQGSDIRTRKLLLLN